MKKFAFDMTFKRSELGKILTAIIEQGNKITRLVYRNGIFVAHVDVQGHIVTAIFI